MNNREIAALTDKYVAKTYARTPLALVKGRGSKVWDANGKEYLDFLAGIAVNILGHAHPALIEAVTRQLSTLGHTSNFAAHEPGVTLAERMQEPAGHAGAERNRERVVRTHHRDGFGHLREHDDSYRMTRYATGRAVLMAAASQSNACEAAPEACVPMRSRDRERRTMRTINGGAAMPFRIAAK